MSLGDPMISAERLAELRLLLSNGFGLRTVDQAALFGELDRLQAHNAYLTEMFYGVASLKLCARHNAVPIVERARDRVVGSWCQDCLAEENARLRGEANQAAPCPQPPSAPDLSDSRPDLTMGTTEAPESVLATPGDGGG